MEIKTYSLKIVRALNENEKGMLLDLSDIPENYEVVLRPINKRKKHPMLDSYIAKEQILYSNEKEH